MNHDFYIVIYVNTIIWHSQRDRIRTILKECEDQNVGVYVCFDQPIQNLQTVRLLKRDDPAYASIMIHAIGIFYFIKRKCDELTAIIEDLYKWKKFFLYQNIDKYGALIRVLKSIVLENHDYANDKFYDYYRELADSNSTSYQNFYHRMKMNQIERHSMNPWSLLPQKEEAVLPPSPPSPPFPPSIQEEKEEEEEEEKEEKKKKNEIIKMNICIDGEKVEMESTRHILCTYYKIHEDGNTNDLQFFSIIENAKSPYFTHIFVYVDTEELGDSLREEFQKYNGENQWFQKITIKMNAQSGGFYFAPIIDEMNKPEYMGDIIYMMRSDVYLQPESLMRHIETSFIGNQRVYVVSRSEKGTNQMIFKDPTYRPLLYANSQDLYIYKSPMKMSKRINMDQLDFYTHKDPLIFNRILEYLDYELINDTKHCKIVRSMAHPNIAIRYILNHSVPSPSSPSPSPSSENDLFGYVPENLGLMDYPLDKLIEHMDLNEDQEYALKKYIFTQFFMKQV